MNVTFQSNSLGDTFQREQAIQQAIKYYSIPNQKQKSSLKDYLNPEGSEIRDGGVEDLFPASHDGDGSSMFAELRRDLETDSGSASGDESYLAFEDVRLERRFHVNKDQLILILN